MSTINRFAILIQSQWSKLLLWMLLNGVGFLFACGCLIIGIIFSALQSATKGVDEISWFLGVGIITGGGAGFFIGMAQWFMIYRNISQSWRWIVWTMMGGAMGNTLLTITIPNLSGKTTMLISAIYWGLFVIFGTIVGLVQWMMLRRHFHKATPWIWANSLGWSLSTVALFWLIRPINEQTIYQIMITGVIGGILYSIFPSLVWAKLVRG